MKDYKQNLTTLSWRFLPVALLFRASNWLQGPYFYQLYSSKTTILTELPGGMTTLYISGYVAGMTAGTLVGSFTDRCGRRNGCVLCGIAFAFTCLTAHSENLWMLLIGRLTAGIASTLLHSAFEAWLVSEATRIGGTEQKLSLVSTVLSSQTSLSSFIAIVSGGVATYAVNAVGVTGASDLALGLLVVGLILVFTTWRENVGVHLQDEKNEKDEKDAKNEKNEKNEKNKQIGMMEKDEKESHNSTIQERRSAMSVLVSRPTVIALGIVQVAYEGTMHIFITLWPEILQETVGKNEKIPFGYIFSGFMISVMIGSELYKLLKTKMTMNRGSGGSGTNNIITMAFMLFIATVALLIPWLAKGHFWATLIAFMLFEITAGGYHPCMGGMRTRLVPSDVSASMITLFRVPQNMLVVGLLLSYKKGGKENSGNGSHTRLLGACGFVLCLSMVILLMVFGVFDARDQVKQKGLEMAEREQRENLKSPEKRA